MLTKYILILLGCYVYSVLSVSTFIDKGQRAELFELIDNEMPTVRVYMPDNDFYDLKKKANGEAVNIEEYTLPRMQNAIIRYLTEVQKINFIESFPGYDFNEMFPQLEIDEDGYANFDIETVASGFDYDPAHYAQDIGIYEVFLNHFLKTNEDFNLFEIIDTIKNIDYSEVNDDDYKINFLFRFEESYFKDLIKKNLSFRQINVDTDIPIFKKKVQYYVQFFKLVNFTEVYPDAVIYQLKIGKDGYAKYDVEEVLAGFNFDPEYYKSLETESYDEIKKMVYESNDDFDLISIRNSLQNSIMTINKNELFEKGKNILKSLELIDNTTSDPLKFSISMINDVPETIVSNDFKTKNATMTFELNGIKKSFEKVTFSIGGQLSRKFSKPHYNLKIRGGKELYGRSQFKLRSDVVEPTYLRTKLASDIYNRLGLKSLSAGYIQLYINDEFMGLYIITDTFHLSWVERVYGDKNSVSLYECHRNNDEYKCTNKNDEIPNEIKDETEAKLNNFLEKIKNAKSASDIEDIFEVEHFLYEMALEYLLFGWDHIITGHNFFFYKQPNGKWIYLSQDFDHEFGHNDENAYKYTVKDFFYIKGKIHIVDILILKDPQRFNEILRDIVQNIFNPSTLYPHINELKQYIKPYVELDKTPDSNGNYPGSINKDIIYDYTMEQWDAYSEFTPGKEPHIERGRANFNEGYVYLSYGLKYYILMKYRNVCKSYNLECDPIYMDKNYVYPINKNVEEYHNIYDEEFSMNDSTKDPFEYPSTTDILIEKPTETPIENSTEPIFNESESSSEEENEYEIDGPTLGIDDESSFDEEDTN